MSQDKAIDAAAELQEIAGARGPADLGGNRKSAPRGARMFLLFSMITVLAVAVGFIWMALNKAAPETAASKGAIVNVLPALTPARPATTVPPDPVKPIVPTLPTLELPTIESLPMPSLPDPVHSRRLRSSLRGEQASDTSSAPAASGPTHVTETGPLASQLEPMRLQPAVAGKLGNRDYLVTQGAMIDCALQTRLITTQAGMLTCVAVNDTYSSNGRVKLIDKGTKFVGYQQGGISQGQARIFVVWSRLESPNGVIVNLDSPGTGSLGEAGLGGFIDHHFWERFGSAIMLSIVGDLGAWVSNSSSKNNGDQVTFQNTQQGANDAISKVLEHTIDIPPTLYKNQGERIGIMVARDLDFSHVYDLRTSHR